MEEEEITFFGRQVNDGEHVKSLSTELVPMRMNTIYF
jgi:hypothetical protein